MNQYSVVGAQNYTYDGNGNLTNDGVNAYTYDAENRLLTVSGGQNSSYEYDGFGRRISKTVDNVTTYYIYDGDRIIEERDANGSLIANYIYGMGIDEILQMNRGGSSYYYHYDGLGSVSDITDSQGYVLESYNYDVYGQPSQLSQIGNRYYFTGREYDAETGLYYYRARMYNPSIGRFMQRDPVTWSPNDIRSLSLSGLDYETDKVIAKGFGLDNKDFDAQLKRLHSIPFLINQIGSNNTSLLHLYLYVGNNPVNWLDPLGFDKGPPSIDDDAIIPVPLWEDPGFYGALGGAALVAGGAISAAASWALTNIVPWLVFINLALSPMTGVKMPPGSGAAIQQFVQGSGPIIQQIFEQSRVIGWP